MAFTPSDIEEVTPAPALSTAAKKRVAAILPGIEKDIVQTGEDLAATQTQTIALGDQNSLARHLKTQTETTTPQVTRVQEKSMLPIVLGAAAFWWFFIR